MTHVQLEHSATYQFHHDYSTKMPEKSQIFGSDYLVDKSMREYRQMEIMWQFID